MAFELRGFLTGIALELSANPLFLDTGKKIVAYSYNGAVLPKLPEWDRERYPYAYIDQPGTGNVYYRLFVTSKPLRWYGGGFCIGAPVTDPEAQAAVFSWRYETTDASGWVEKGEGNLAVLNNGGVWTNTDLINEDGTVYLAASEPVPVYE